MLLGFLTSTSHILQETFNFSNYVRKRIMTYLGPEPTNPWITIGSL